MEKGADTTKWEVNYACKKKKIIIIIIEFVSSNAQRTKKEWFVWRLKKVEFLSDVTRGRKGGPEADVGWFVVELFDL